MPDFEKMAADVVKAAQDFVSRAMAGMAKRVDDLVLTVAAFESRFEALPAPAKGDIGPSAYEIAFARGFKGSEPEWIESLRGKDGVNGAAGDRGEKGEPGADGAPGKDGEQGCEGVAGKDGAPGEAGKDGADGAPGTNGRDGVDGKDGAPGKDGQSVDPETVRAMVAEVAAAIPKAKDGERGVDGVNGKDGADGRSVLMDDIAPQMESAFAKWALEFERRAQDIFRSAIAAMPKPKDGVDGIGFDDLSVEHSDGVVTLKFVRGEIVKTFEMRFPCFKDRGVYREDVKDYREGHGVTYGGSFFIIQRDNPQGRPEESDDFRLAVKRGRDGKDLTPAAPRDPVVRLR